MWVENKKGKGKGAGRDVVTQSLNMDGVGWDVVLKLSLGVHASLTSNVARWKWGLESRPGGWVESQEDFRGNTQDVTIPDTEHGEFPSGAEDLVFFSFQSISKMYFVPKGRNHHLRTELFFLPLPGFSYPKTEAACALHKAPRDEGFVSQTPGHSLVTTEESEHSGLQFRGF